MALHTLTSGPFKGHKLSWSPDRPLRPNHEIYEGTWLTADLVPDPDMDVPIVVKVVDPDFRVVELHPGATSLPGLEYRRERSALELLLRRAGGQPGALSWLQRPLSELEDHDDGALAVLERYGETVWELWGDRFGPDARTTAFLNGSEGQFDANLELLVATVVVCGYDALRTLSDLGIAHRDPHPGNLLVLTPDVGLPVAGVVLVDFSHATTAGSTASVQREEHLYLQGLGLPLFQPPELWDTKRNTRRAPANLWTDLFGLGVSACILLSNGATPWRNVADRRFVSYGAAERPDATMTERILAKSVVYDEPSESEASGRLHLQVRDPELRTVVSALLKADPVERYEALNGEAFAGAMATLKDRVGVDVAARRTIGATPLREVDARYATPKAPPSRGGGIGAPVAEADLVSPGVPRTRSSSMSEPASPSALMESHPAPPEGVVVAGAYVTPPPVRPRRGPVRSEDAADPSSQTGVRRSNTATPPPPAPRVNDSADTDSDDAAGRTRPASEEVGAAATDPAPVPAHTREPVLDVVGFVAIALVALAAHVAPPAVLVRAGHLLVARGTLDIEPRLEWSLAAGGCVLTLLLYARAWWIGWHEDTRAPGRQASAVVLTFVTALVPSAAVLLLAVAQRAAAEVTWLPHHVSDWPPSLWTSAAGFLLGLLLVLWGIVETLLSAVLNDRVRHTRNAVLSVVLALVVLTGSIGLVVATNSALSNASAVGLEAR